MCILSLNILKRPKAYVPVQMMERILFTQISDRRQNVTNWDQLPLMLTTNDLMNILGVSRTRAYQIINIAGFPAVRIGKLVYMEKYALRQWLEEQSN